MDPVGLSIHIRTMSLFGIPMTSVYPNITRLLGNSQRATKIPQVGIHMGQSIGTATQQEPT